LLNGRVIAGGATAREDRGCAVQIQSGTVKIMQRAPGMPSGARADADTCAPDASIPQSQLGPPLRRCCDVIARLARRLQHQRFQGRMDGQLVITGGRTPIPLMNQTVPPACAPFVSRRCQISVHTGPQIIRLQSLMSVAKGHPPTGMLKLQSHIL
jgi:hypothetical protein